MGELRVKFAADPADYRDAESTEVMGFVDATSDIVGNLGEQYPLQGTILVVERSAYPTSQFA